MLIQSHCYENEKKNGKNSSTIPLGNTKVTSYSVSVFFPLFFDFVFICPQCWFLSLQLWCSEWKICLEIPSWNYGTSFGEWRSSFFLSPKRNSICLLLLVTSVGVLFFNLYPSALHRNSKLLPNKIAVIRLKRRNVHKM